MLAWMVYVAAVSLLLGLAALAAERSAQMRRAPARGLWGASIIASLALPAVISSVSIRIPNFLGAARSFTPPEFPLWQFTAGVLQPTAWLDTTIGPLGRAPSLDALLAWAWLAASVIFLLVILANGALPLRRKRSWERRTIAATPVFVSEDVGPAVVGLLRPCIVIPRWIAGATPETQALVLAHERSHLEASDARLLAIAILLIAAAPWNLPLWWQLQRLRFAIEVDCDRRVLNAGHDVGRYGETLIVVAQRQSRRIGVVAAMSESRSSLEQRISKMVSKPKKLAWAGATALAGLAFVLAASAAEISPPNASPLVPAAASAAAGMRHYRDSQGRFVLDVPTGWNDFPLVQAQNPNAVARFLAHEGGRTQELIVFRGPYDPAKGAKGFFDQVEPVLAGAGFEHFVRGEVRLGSRAVQTLDFDERANGELWSCRYFVFPTDEAIYILGFGATDPGTTFPLAERVAATFAVEHPAAASASDIAVPASYASPVHAEVSFRLVDDAPDAAQRARDERVTGPDGGELWLAPGVRMSGIMFASAKVGRDANGDPSVDFTLTPEGKRHLAEITGQNVGRRLALLVNDEVLWAPRIRSEISGGAGQITGHFTPAEADALAKDIAGSAQ